MLPEEVRMIVAMDGAFREQCRDEQKESRDEKSKSNQPPAPKPTGRGKKPAARRT